MTYTVLYARPYDISAKGFYFETIEHYERHSANAVNDFGQTVEEFEIQFIDGDDIDNELASVWELDQTSFAAYLGAVEDWDTERKRHYIIAVGECGYDRDTAANDPDGPDIDIYYVDSLRDLAEEFVDEGFFGPIPEALQFYIDHDAIARDLAVDFTETEIAGERLVYACR